MRQNLNIETPDSWCYDDDPSNCEIYGRLYTWKAAKSACASMGGGWRLPDTADWNKLVSYAGGRGVAERKLKSKTGWKNDLNDTDDYGFSALPGGTRNFDGSPDNVPIFYGAGNDGYWWSGTGNAYGRGMYYYNDIVYEGSYGIRSFGFSVRCVAAAQ